MKKIKFYTDDSQNIFDILIVFENEINFYNYILNKKIKNKLKKLNAKNVLINFGNSFYLIAITKNNNFDFKESRVIASSLFDINKMKLEL